MTIISTFHETTNATDYINAKKTVHSQMEPFRQLAPLPFGGQYLNEVCTLLTLSCFQWLTLPAKADPLESDWQHAQWGSNYDRLLKIKKEIDPDDLLIVYHGVNSEDWDDEIICKTSTVTGRPKFF